MDAVELRALLQYVVIAKAQCTSVTCPRVCISYTPPPMHIPCTSVTCPRVCSDDDDEQACKLHIIDDDEQAHKLHILDQRAEGGTTAGFLFRSDMAAFSTRAPGLGMRLYRYACKHTLWPLDMSLLGPVYTPPSCIQV